MYVVSNKNLEKTLLAALATLPDLDELGMGPMRFGVHQLSKGARIQVRKLGIFNNSSDYNPNKSATVLGVFSGGRLEDLTILSRVYSLRIVGALIQQNHCTLLKSFRLKLHPQDIKHLIPFLVSFPNLESIDICLVKHNARLQSYVSIPNPLPRLPRSALLRLKSFSGVEKLATMIVPGRPVQNVTIEARYH